MLPAEIEKYPAEDDKPQALDGIVEPALYLFIPAVLSHILEREPKLKLAITQ